MSIKNIPWGIICAVILFSAVIVYFVLYSYSQIDLNLTLSSNLAYQQWQNGMIRLGYYERQLSGSIFLLMLVTLFGFYLFFFRLGITLSGKKFNTVVFLLTSVSILLLFAYPAFSHDLFNYMFDARILTKYGVNPYQFSALDFPDDLWTRFMHWTHRTYPYGPLWLAVTLPFSVLGLGKFVPTLLLFKILFLVFHLGNILLVKKIAAERKPGRGEFAAFVYALNPLVLVESLVSPHNDVIMLFFLLLAVYLSQVKKHYLTGVLFITVSFLSKLTTVSLLPLFIFIKNSHIRKNFFTLAIILYSLTLVFQISMREPYPWYFIPLVALAAAGVFSNKILILMIALTGGLMLRYYPFIATGEYNQANQHTQMLFTYLPVCAAGLLLLLFSDIRLFRVKGNPKQPVTE